MREMKDSGIQWLREYPANWNLIKIKYCLKERVEKNNPVRTTEILSLTAKQGVIPYDQKEGGGNKPKEDVSAYRLAYPGDIVMNSMNILSGSVGLSNYFGFVQKQWPDEKYKWEAVKCFQLNWNVNAEDFAQMLAKSLAQTGNLLASVNNFPARMITKFAEIASEEVRSMYIELFDETKDVCDRVASFKDKSNSLLERYGNGAAQHYQYENAIMTYLWLRYPDKYYIYSHTTQKQFDKHTLHSNNLYQIFTYVKNRHYEFGDADHVVSGMLLYAKTEEEIQPDNVFQLHGNQISVKTLDLNKPFDEIAKQLDEIAAAHFDGIEKAV